MYCCNCGKQISDNSNFCPSCGSKVKRIIPKDSLSDYNVSNTNNRNIFEQIKEKFTNSQIAILVLSIISFLVLMIIPYTIVTIHSHSYPIKLIGENDYSLRDGFEIALSFFLLAFIICIIVIITSLFINRAKLCMGFCIANIVFAVYGLCIIMATTTEKSGVNCAPIGASLYLGLAIIILVFAVKEKRSKIRK